MIRFFTNPENIEEKHIRLSDEDSRHIRSLRVRPKEEFIVCDGAGTDYVCELCAGTREVSVGFTGTAKILRREETRGEPTVSCTMYIAYAKGDRLDYAVQKAVELGAKAIVLFKSKRCIAVPDNIQKKLARLQKIAYEAAKQSGRGIIPTVKNGGEYEEIIDTATRESELPILLFEGEETLHLKEVIEQYPFCAPFSGRGVHNKHTVAIISGPEGGFEICEAKAAKAKGVHVVSIGLRILRSETAPIVALSALMYHTNNL